ncbi:hypothetical protein ACFQPA_17200 [Halomarina halobia]
MLRKVLTLYIGRRWRSFCGMSREQFLSRATDSLDALGYEYSTEVIDTTGAEKLMLGAGDEGVRIDVEAPVPFTVEAVTAKSNPVVGYMLKFFSTEEMREEMTADVCVVDVRGIDADSRPAIASFVSELVERSDRPPWRLTHHVGFRLAVLLRLKVKLLWRYWLGVDRSTATTPS